MVPTDESDPEQPVRGSESGRRNGGWRKWLGATGQATRWGYVLHLTLGLVVGALCGVAFSPPGGALLSALVAGVVAAAAISVPAINSFKVALVVSLVAAFGTLVGFTAAHHPLWAATAMAAMAVLTSLAASAGPVGVALGTIATFLFAGVVAVARVSDLTSGIPFPSALARIGIGMATGLLIALVSMAVRRQLGRPGASGPSGPEAPGSTGTGAGGIPGLVGPMGSSLRRFDEFARDGVRRAIPLTLGVFFFEAWGDRNSLWIFFSAFVVLLPTGKPPVVLALVRSASTIGGVVLLSALALVVPHKVLFPLALVLVLLGMAYSSSFVFLGGALNAMGAVLLASGPAGHVGSWALYRVADTLIGCGFALASTYLLWPRDKPDVGRTWRRQSAEGEPPSFSSREK